MFSTAKKPKDRVTITHQISEREAITTVKLPGKRPITKRWVRSADGATGKFKLDWDEDPRLAGWEPVIEAARQVPDFL